MSDQEVTERLDHLIGLYELVNASTLREVRAEARKDETTGAILESSEDWIASGVMKRQVAVLLGTSEKTVQRRILDLVARRALVSRRTDGGIHYKRSGLI